jgi:transposase
VEAATVEAARVEAARVVAARVEARGEGAMDEAAGRVEVGEEEAEGEEAEGENAMDEEAIVESTPVKQGKVAKKEEAARVKKLKAQAKRDAIKAAKVEEARKVKAARVETGEEATAPQLNCCLKCVLSNEPDFLEQKEWLTTVVEAVGFTIMFFPKYHCEFNFIEMIWGWCKSHHRRTCTYNYNDLKKNLPTTLSKTMPLAFVRRAARFCLRFMSGYRAGLSGPLLDFTMKQYKSHRTIPLGIVDTVTKEFSEYLVAKALKAKK